MLTKSARRSASSGWRAAIWCRDHLFRAEVERRGPPRARVPIAAAGAFQHEAAARGGIDDALRGRLLRQGSGLSDGPVGAQDIVEGIGPGLDPMIQNAGVQAGLVAKGGVEARRVDPQRLGDVGDADGVVSARVEEMLGGGDRPRRDRSAGDVRADAMYL